MTRLPFALRVARTSMPPADGLAMRLDAVAANANALRLYRGLGYRDAGGVTFRKGHSAVSRKR
jgi:hypothetical protein